MSNKFSAASLGPRIVSAVFAGLLVIAAGYFFNSFGLQLIVLLSIGLMAREYGRIAFVNLNAPESLRWWFIAMCLVLAFGLFYAQEPMAAFGLCCSVFFAVAMWLTRNKLTNEKLLPALTMAGMGLLFCVLFPSFELFTLKLPNGLRWFTLHLLVVFAGDIFAYFGGILFGKTKLMPQISPKKTVAGAVMGLIGSTVAGVGFATIWMTSVPVLLLVGFCLACGFAAQMGDLTISLFKRVAQVKDSGSLLPGHGGILDRLDGVILTAPMIYALAWFVETRL